MIIQKKLIKPIENKGAVKIPLFSREHSTTTNRDAPNQHPQEAITGLTSDLNTIRTDIVDNSASVSSVKSEITKLQVEIDAKPDKLFVETQLANKANKTEIDTIDAALEVHSTNISDNAANILLKANETELVNKQDKLTAGANIDITDNVISSTGGGGSGDVTLDTAQNITGIKTFTNGIKNNLVEVNGKSLIVKNSGGGSNYFEIEQTYTSGYKNWFGVLFFRTTGTSREELSSIQVRQDDGLYIVSNADLLFSAANIKFGNARLQQVGAPTADYDAATKKYADDGLALKQNKLTAGTNITITDDVISASGGAAGVTLDTAQTITGIKTFENGIKNNLVEVDGKSLIIKNSSTAASYLEVESVYSGSGYKNWFGIQLFRTTGTSRPRLANVEIRQDDGLYIDSVNDLSIQGANIKFNNVRLQQVGAPTLDADAATKKYADDGLALKQNKLTAGTNITIVGDTISSSGGTTNGVTLDTNQTITGEKTFTEAITINGNDGKKYSFNTNARGGLIFSAPNYIINKVGVKNIIGFYEDGFTSCFHNRIIEVGTPTADYDAATKKYVDDAIAAALRPYLIDLEKRYGKGK